MTFSFIWNLHFAHTWPVVNQIIAEHFVKTAIIRRGVPSTDLKLSFPQSLQTATTTANRF